MGVPSSVVDPFPNTDPDPVGSEIEIEVKLFWKTDKIGQFLNEIAQKKIYYSFLSQKIS